MKTIFYTFLFFILTGFCNAQWIQMSNGMETTQSINALVSSGDIIFTGTFASSYFSTNNGSSWTQTSLNNQAVICIAALGINIFAGTCLNGIYLSTNNGTNWTQTTLNNKCVYSLATLGNNVFAGTLQTGVYFSTNNGLIWSQTAFNNKSVVSLTTSGNNVFAGTSDSGVYLSTNNGTSWTQTSLNNQHIASLTTIGNNIFAGTEYNGVYLSTNNGTNWTQTSLNNKMIYSLATFGNSIFAGTNNGVYFSTNNGINWFIKNQGFNLLPGIGALLITNNHILAGTYGQSIWRRDLSEIIEIHNISTEIPSVFLLYQNYPNPFNPTTKIRFDISNRFPIGALGNDKIILKVFDILGREVITLVDEKLQPGTYEVTFNGNNLPSGIYFYRLKSGDFIETKKLILIK